MYIIKHYIDSLKIMCVKYLKLKGKHFCIHNYLKDVSDLIHVFT